METIKDKLSEYISLHAEIIKAFEQDGWEAVEDNMGVIEDNTRNRWHFQCGGITFLDKDGVEHGYDDATESVKEVDGCRLFYIEDGGKNFFAMFSSSNKYDDYDEYCNQMGVKA